MDDGDPGGGHVGVVRALDLADDPRAWTGAGFAVTEGEVRLGGVALRCTGQTGRHGITGWAVEPPPAAPIDGLAVAEGRSDWLVTPSAHPNTAVAIDHLVIATPDLEATTDAFAAQGWQPRRTIDDPRGAPRRMRFFVVPAGDGQMVLEVIAHHEGGPSTTTFWGLAVTVTDLDEAGRAVDDDVVGRPQDAVQPGRRIATVQGERIGVSIPLAFMSPR